MTSPAEIANAFIREMGSARADRNRRACDVLLPAAAGEPIYGGEFTDAKRVLDYSFEQAFGDFKTANMIPTNPNGSGYFYPSGGVTPWGAINDSLGYALGLRSAIAMAKKAAKIKSSDPYLQQVRAFLAACVPMAELVEAVKKRVIKGRRPPVVSTKERRIAGRVSGSATCQICAGDQALVRGKISLHGYNRPGVGFIVGQCRGANELPFEVSCEVLRKWIGTLRSMLTKEHDWLARLPFETSILLDVLVRENGRLVYRYGKTVYRKEPVDKGDPRFADALYAETHQTKSRIRALTTEIAHQQKRLEGWSPVAGFAS